MTKWRLPTTFLVRHRITLSLQVPSFVAQWSSGTMLALGLRFGIMLCERSWVRTPVGPISFFRLVMSSGHLELRIYRNRIVGHAFIKYSVPVCEISSLKHRTTAQVSQTLTTGFFVSALKRARGSLGGRFRPSLACTLRRNVYWLMARARGSLRRHD